MQETRPPTRPPSYAWLARATIVVLLVLAVFWLLARTVLVLLLLFASLIVASILVSTAGLVRKVLPIKQKWALMLAGLMIALAVGGFTYLLGSRIGAQFASLSEEIPNMVDNAGSWLGIQNAWNQVTELASDGFLIDLFGYVPNLVAGVSALVLVIFGGVFLASQPERYRRGILLLMPQEHRERVESALVNAGRALQLWLVGKLIAMVVVGVATTAGLLLIGVPSAFALGLIAGLFEFVPFVGPILAFVPAALTALSQDITMFWWVLGLYVVIQQIESNLLVPLIQERTVELPPVLGLFAIVAAGILFGPLGIVLGVPLTVLLLVLVKQLYVRDVLGDDVSVPGEKQNEG